jgi:ABC-2 type transport system permease protein
VKIIDIAKKNFSMNKVGILIFSGLIGLFFLWFASIYDPELFAGLEEVFESYPEAIKSLVGGRLLITNFNGFLNTYLFSFSWMYIGIYFVLKASQDIPTEVEEKTIEIVISKPMKRWEYILGKLTKHIFVLLTLIGITMIAVFLAPFIFPTINPNEVNFSSLALGFILLSFHLLSLIATGFVFSTYFSRKKALALSFGAIIFYFAVGQFSGLFPEAIQNVKYFSIFYYFDTYTLLVDASLEGFFINVLVMAVYSIVLIIASLYIFQKRNIPV